MPESAICTTDSDDVTKKAASLSRSGRIRLTITSLFNELPRFRSWLPISMAFF